MSQPVISNPNPFEQFCVWFAMPARSFGAESMRVETKEWGNVYRYDRRIVDLFRSFTQKQQLAAFSAVQKFSSSGHVIAKAYYDAFSITTQETYKTHIRSVARQQRAEKEGYDMGDWIVGRELCGPIAIAALEKLIEEKSSAAILTIGS